MFVCGFYGYFEGGENGKLYDDYDSNDVNLPVPKNLFSRPVVWNRVPSGSDRYGIIFGNGSIYLIPNRERGKFVGYCKWPIENIDDTSKLSSREFTNSGEVYEFDGLFAGAVFVFQRRSNRGELIIKGSGRPIVLWQRGYVRSRKLGGY